MSKLKTQLTFKKVSETNTVTCTLVTNEQKNCDVEDADHNKNNEETLAFNNNNNFVNNTKPVTVTLYNPAKDATKAVLLWCLELIKTKGSANSCSGKAELFKTMFPNSVPQNFSICPKKATYYITEALGPYFEEALLNELSQKDVKFTLQFDETSNVKTKKELQIRVIFWSNTEKKVVNRYLETKFIERGTGEIIFNNLLSTLDSKGLRLNQILTLAMDGPNVNKKVFRLFQEKLKELKYKNMIDIGSCDIHSMHNAFLKGLESMSVDVSDFIFQIHHFFIKEDSRYTEYEKIQEDLKLPSHRSIVHVPSRWLTIGQSAERLLEQFPGLTEYFLKFIPKKYPKTLPAQCAEIIKYLKNPIIKCILQFT